MTVQLSVIVPTFLERDNVAPVVEALDQALKGVLWEVVFVDDDSPDGTARVARAMAMLDPRIRVIQRVGRRGLATACIEGLLASSAPYLAVMDADLQHDERQLPAMLALLQEKDVDVVVGSRYIAGGGTGEWAESRRKISRIACRLSDILVGTGLTDAMSGFFVLRAETLHAVVHRLSGTGFKILLDILVSGRSLPNHPVRFLEFPYEMRPRRRGESKLDMLVVYEYLALLLDKRLGRFMPARFILFVGAGLLGACIHLVLLWTLMFPGGKSFLPAQSVATAGAIVCNFFVNNALTYRDLRCRGWQVIPGLLAFSVACSIGAITNVALALFLYSRAGFVWWTAALAGSAIGSVWNYALSSVYVWRPSRGDVLRN